MGHLWWFLSLVLLLLLLLPAHSCGKFYIGLYKTVASPTGVGQSRSLPYIVYPGEEGSESVAFDQYKQKRWRVEHPPNRRLGHLEPATAFGLTNNYGNDPYKGYTLVHKHQVKYVVPPFTPGGRVHVAFQFWIPISLGGFFVSGRELEAALKSPSPTAYITTLFLKHLSANTTAGELLGHLEAPVVETAIDRFLDRVVPYLHRFTGSIINTVNTFTPLPDKKKKHKAKMNKRNLVRDDDRNKRRAISPSFNPQKSEVDEHMVKRNTSDSECLSLSTVCSDEDNDKTKHFKSSNGKTRRKHRIEKSGLDGVIDHAERKQNGVAQDARNHLASRAGVRRHRRQVPDSSDGWVTIGGGSAANDAINPTAPLMTRPPAWSSYRPSQLSNNRLMWDDDQHVITHNDLSFEQDKRPSFSSVGIDLTSPIDYPSSRPRPVPVSFSSSSPSSWPSFSSRPTTRPSSTSYPSHSLDSQFTEHRPSSSSSSSSSSPSSSSPVELRPPFHLTSFDDLPSGATPNPQVLDVRSRLSRLDYLFNNFHLDHEDCRRRILCEVSREPDTFAPLSDMVHGETRLPGNPLDVSRELLTTAEGARLLSYVEAVKVGEDRSQVCDVYRYRCRVEARQVINTDILPIWREVVRWLTVKVLTQDFPKI